MFDENVQGVDIYNPDLVSDSGSAVIDSVTQVDAKTYNVQCSGVADSDGYDLEVFDTITTTRCVYPLKLTLPRQ